MVITSSHAVSLPFIPNIEQVETFKHLSVIVSNDLSGTHTLLQISLIHLKSHRNPHFV